MEGFEALLQQWMAAQPGVTDTVDTLVCDGKTLRGSIAENASGAARYGLWPTASTLPRRASTPTRWAWPTASQKPGGYAQSTYATDAGGEIAALRKLLDRVELDGLLVQADALNANRGFFSTSSSLEPTS